jgi:DNA-binding transcriptional LysR family regulator
LVLRVQATEALINQELFSVSANKQDFLANCIPLDLASSVRMVLPIATISSVSTSTNARRRSYVLWVTPRRSGRWFRRDISGDLDVGPAWRRSGDGPSGCRPRRCMVGPALVAAGLQVIGDVVPSLTIPVYLIWHETRRADDGHRWLRDLVAQTVIADTAC